ncbi:hypothetical protein DSM112329_00464 [Paraconexibacter sp. AEG42_29]|uniref:EAL domain-containing protein n=1 Tax=Paraconexibacter sp. AEG42_29 TaxID=2997339 RepID=A0AAU7APN9_9ACTN
MFATVIGAVTLAGWLLGVRGLTSVVPGMPEMKVLTAIGLVASGTALVCLAPAGAPRSLRVGRAGGGLVAAIGAAVCFEYLVQPVGIDQLLFRDPAATLPGRPSPHTAVAFIALGLALVTVDLRRLPGWVHPALVAVLAGVVEFALVGYVYGVDYLRGLSGQTGMAPNTLVALVALTVGVLALRPDRGIASLLRGADAGAQMARALIPVATMGPVALGAVRFVLQEHGLIGLRVGLATFTLSMVFLLTAAVVIAAARARAVDHERAAAQQRFSDLLESAPDGMVIVDETGVIVLVNARAKLMFGYAEQELVGQPVEVLLPAAVRAAHREHRAGFAAAPAARGMGGDLELEAVRRDGSTFLVEVSLSPLQTPGGLLVSSAIRDVTARAAREAEEAAIRRVAELVAQNGAPGVVFDAVAREIGDLLSATSAAVMRFDAERREGRIVGGWNVDGAQIKGARFDLDGRTASSAVFRTGRAACVEDLADAVDGVGPLVTAASLRTGVAAPIRVAGQLWGAVGAGFAGPATDEALVRLDRFAVLVALAIANREQELALREAEGLHRALLDNLPGTAVTLYDEDLRVQSIRGPILREAGVDPAQFLGRPICETVPAATLAIVEPLLRTALEGHGGATEYRSSATGGDIHIEVVPHRDGEGRIVGAMSVSRDITARLERERALDASRAELALAKQSLEAILLHTPAAVFLKDRDQRFLVANAETARVVGFPGQDITGRSLWDMYPHDVVEILDANDAAVMNAGTPVKFEETAPDQDDDGRTHTWLAVKFPVRDQSDAVVGIGGISMDITDHKEAELARRAAEERFEVMFENAAVPMSVIALEGEDAGKVLDANPAYAELLGCDRDEIIGHGVATWMHPDDHESAYARPMRQLADGEVDRTRFERRYLHRDGHVVWTLVTNAAYTDAHGRRIAVGQILDISDRKHLEGRLQELADHDPLTGLFNRRRFQNELDGRLAHARRYGGTIAVLAIDLDGFKFVNDSLGHAVGDELVTRLGGVLRRSLRESDVVARTGGDEFAVILPGADEAGAREVASKLVIELRNAGKIVDRHRHANVTASIGITILGDGEQITAEDLLVEADIAMYDAKAAGKNGYAIHQRDEGRREQIQVRQDWLARLRDAVEHERFELFAQPIVPVCSNGLPRYELLLRLPDGHGDLIPPGSFLYNAERFNLIGQIDFWVMTQAVRLLHHQHACGHDLAVSINVSAKTINGGGVIDHLRSLMARWPIPTGRLVLELTETAAIANIERAQELASDLHELGCGLALDDFGAGFATFYYLKHLRFDFVKIDGEFIKRLPDNPTDQLVVKAVVDIARGMGADTIAEYVQDDATLDVLTRLGVGYAQGYHTGRPVALSSILTASPADA